MKTNEIKDRLLRGSKDLQNFLRTEQGKKSMMVLEAMYGGTSLVPNDPTSTSYRLGQSEVLDYLIDLRDGKDVV